MGVGEIELIDNKEGDFASSIFFSVSRGGRREKTQSSLSFCIFYQLDGTCSTVHIALVICCKL